MPAGQWSFLQEFVIYEYLMHRKLENNLRLKQIVQGSKRVLKEKFLNVSYLEDVKNGYFPDIDLIELKGDKMGKRPAEVKFITSAFEYHKSKKHELQFQDFVSNNGCIIVLSHDYIPPSLINNYTIDVYEIDMIDFVSFTKENFMRLLNRQIKVHGYQKTWLMIQSKNFNEGTLEVRPARESGIWCPVDSLSGLELGIGDRIIFVKTKGASKQNVNKYWSRSNQVFEKWTLDELWIGEVTSQIVSREEYYMIKRIPPKTPLWYDETIEGKSDSRVTSRKNTLERWKRVFEFKHKRTFDHLDIRMSELHIVLPDFVRCTMDIFIGQGSREITSELYTSLMEFLVERERTLRNSLAPVLAENSLNSLDNDFLQ